MSYYFPMECRRWAPMRSVAGSFLPLCFLAFLPFIPPLCRFDGTVWVDGLGLDVRDIVGMRVSLPKKIHSKNDANRSRIVEYATREQAQNAVNTLSNQNLMGRLVYVREVFPLCVVVCLVPMLTLPGSGARTSFHRWPRPRRLWRRRSRWLRRCLWRRRWWWKTALRRQCWSFPSCDRGRR